MSICEWYKLPRKSLKGLEDFYRYGGIRLNFDKTEAIWLGRNNRTGKICNITITKKPIKCTWNMDK